jgi:hypothetical protein
MLSHMDRKYYLSEVTAVTERSKSTTRVMEQLLQCPFRTPPTPRHYIRQYYLVRWLMYTHLAVVHIFWLSI